MAINQLPMLANQICAESGEQEWRLTTTVGSKEPIKILLTIYGLLIIVHYNCATLELPEVTVQ